MPLPTLAIDTSERNVGYYGMFRCIDSYEIHQVADVAANLVIKLSKICTLERPQSLLWVYREGGSYTGLRIGWCVLRTISHVWKVPIWNAKVDRASPEKLIYGLRGAADYNYLIQQRWE